MELCTYGKFKPFLMDEKIVEELNAIIVLAKMCDWQLTYDKSTNFWSNELEISLKLKNIRYEIKITVSKLDNLVKWITYSKEIPFPITNYGSFGGSTKETQKEHISHIDKVFKLLNKFKQYILKGVDNNE